MPARRRTGGARWSTAHCQNLPYDYGALAPHITGEIMELHHGKHHQTSVNGLNETLDKLAAARDNSDFGAIVGLERSLAFHLGGHINHPMFWNNMSPDGGGRPTGELMWEHAFYLRYKNVKPDYVKAWWNVVNWDDAAARFARHLLRG